MSKKEFNIAEFFEYLSRDYSLTSIHREKGWDIVDMMEFLEGLSDLFYKLKGDK